MKTFNTSDLPNGHLYGLLADEINETFWGDLEFIKTLRLLAQKADSENLRKECDNHSWQIEKQLVRLKKASALSGVELKAKENHIMAALIKDTVEALDKYKATETPDTVVISNLRKACQFRKTMYQSVITYFGLLGFEEPEMIIAKTQSEEEMADDRLLSITYEKLVDIDGVAGIVV